ncbi:hypothetical protein [Limosilactobacillus mucosae]|uniref:hypothetical protein n=1 Tax=Limosilactobacillus mucosae TaxID=97478 RepID=UPI0022E50CAA|nr:hypothetical protein [Limosilactobacillus mucosae]
MNNQNNEFLNWGEGFTAQEDEYVLLDEGVYNFTISKMEKKVYDGNSSKIPNGCPYAELTIQVESSKGTANIRERLYLMKSMQWKLTQFFAGIGQPVVTGQVFNPNWETVVGSKGRAEITQHHYTNQNGDDRTNNQVARYLKPQDPTPALNANQQSQQMNQKQGQMPQQQMPFPPQQPQQPFNGQRPQQPFNGLQGAQGGQPGAF